MELRRRLHLDGNRVGACCECEACGAVCAVQDVDGMRGGARVAQGGAGVEATSLVSVCSRERSVCEGEGVTYPEMRELVYTGMGG